MLRIAPLRLAGAALALIAALASPFVAAPARAADPPSFGIGALLAMTGSAPFYGTVMSRGAQLAVDEINAKGGIDGIKLELFIEDHKSGNAKEAVAGMNRLISLHNVQAVETSFTPPTLAVAPIADEKQIFMLNGGGVSQTMVGASKYLVHNRSLAADLARALVVRAKERGFKKMAIVVWKTDAGDNAREILTKEWKAAGGEVVADESVVPDAANIDTQVAKLRASNPDFIASAVFRPTVGLLLKRVRELGMKQPLIGLEYTPDDAKTAGKQATGFEYVTDYFQPSADNPWSERFAKAYKEKYGEEPEFYAANYYEGIYVIAEAIRRARKKGGDYWNGARLMDALKENPVVDSVYGTTMRFQDNGVAQKRVGLFEVTDGEKDEKKFVKFIAAP